MKYVPLKLRGLALIQLDVHKDGRGFFVERYREIAIKQIGRQNGFDVNLVQDNHSRSAPGTLRGLHFQHSPAQGKLVGVTRGKILDIAVDIRPDSQTFGKYHAEELDDVGGKLFWIPAGFAHGFCVLGDEPADVYYKTTAYYNGPGEAGIKYNDADLAIKWPIESPTLSPRDMSLMSFKDYMTWAKKNNVTFR